MVKNRVLYWNCLKHEMNEGYNMIIAVLDFPRFPDSAWDVLSSLVGVVNAFMVRARDLPPVGLLELSSRIKDRIGDAPLIVNGSLEVALGLPSEGLHLPAHHLRAAMVRRWWRGQLSASVHNLDELSHHEASDWVVWGHAFETRSKPGARASSWDSLHQVVQASSRPVLAIGGINEDNVHLLRQTGIHGVLISDGIWQRPDPVLSARRIQSSFHDSGIEGAKYDTHR